MADERVLQGVSVVIVDDNDTTRAMLRGILRQEGADVIGEAKDGASGVAACLKFKPKLVCLDVMMPGSNGVDVLKELKNQLPDTRVLMVTGSTDRDTVQAAIQGGASGYVVKPFNAARVVGAVRAAFAAKPGSGAESQAA